MLLRGGIPTAFLNINPYLLINNDTMAEKMFQYNRYLIPIKNKQNLDYISKKFVSWKNKNWNGQ